MPGFLLNSTAPVTCFHGTGKVTVAPLQTRVAVMGDFVATTANVITVAGCLFQVPVPGGTKPQPCVTVKWPNVSGRVKVMGMPVLLQASPGPGNGVGVSVEQIPGGPVTLGLLLTRAVGQ
jgi:hypothetical protein